MYIILGVFLLGGGLLFILDITVFENIRDKRNKPKYIDYDSRMVRKSNCDPAINKFIK